jgi:hypothetical protein
MERDMTDGQGEGELINGSAERFGVPVDVLTALLALEEEFENFHLFGAKAEFSRQVAKILDEASGHSGA